MANANRKKIGKISAKLASLILKMIENRFIEYIPNPRLKSFLKISLSPLRKSIDALVDEDPNNKEQLEKIWTQLASSEEFEDFTINQLRAVLEIRVRNGKMKPEAVDLIMEIVEAGIDITDEL